MGSRDHHAQRILASPWGEWLVIWASPHLTLKVTTLGSGFFLPFCPFLRANLSDWLEVLLSLTKRNLTERSLHLSGRHGQVLKISLPGWESTCVLWGLFCFVFFSSDAKELICCYLLNFPKSASQSHSKVHLTFVPARSWECEDG